MTIGSGRSGRRGPTRGLGLTLAALLAIGLAALNSGAAGAPPGAPRFQFGTSPVATGVPALPPPSPYLHLLPRFFDLLESYVALDAGDKVPFAGWVVLNGITDPRMIDGMVTLYEWYHRALSVA